MVGLDSEIPFCLPKKLLSVVPVVVVVGCVTASVPSVLSCVHHHHHHVRVVTRKRVRESVNARQADRQREQEVHAIINVTRRRQDDKGLEMTYQRQLSGSAVAVVGYRRSLTLAAAAAGRTCPRSGTADHRVTCPGPRSIVMMILLLHVEDSCDDQSDDHDSCILLLLFDCCVFCDFQETWTRRRKVRDLAS